MGMHKRKGHNGRQYLLILLLYLDFLEKVESIGFRGYKTKPGTG
jgi:hypothetical protein